MKVKRSDGTIVDKTDYSEAQLEALYNSWDYWESRGLPHPMKRAKEHIASMEERKNDPHRDTHPLLSR